MRFLGANAVAPRWKGVVVASLFLIAMPFSAQPQEMAVPEFSLSLAGDSIIMTPAVVHQSNPKFATLRNVIHQSDAAFTNLEGTFPSRNSYPAAEPRATWISVDPAMLKELQWVGFNLFSNANNHAMDFGIDGLLNTMREMKQAGAYTIAQDEATSIVFGMPNEAIKRGGVDKILPLGSVAKAILAHG